VSKSRQQYVFKSNAQFTAYFHTPQMIFKNDSSPHSLFRNVIGGDYNFKRQIKYILSL